MSKGTISLTTYPFIPYQVSRNCIKIYQGDDLIWEYNAQSNKGFLKYNRLNMYNSFRTVTPVIITPSTTSLYDGDHIIDSNFNSMFEAYEYPSDPILYENLKIYNAFNIASKYLNLVYDQDYIHGIDASIGNANYLGTAPSASALYDTDHIIDSNFNSMFEAYEYPVDPILYENLKIYNTFNIASKYLNVFYDQEYIHGIDASIGNANYLGTAPSTSAVYDNDHIIDSNFNLLFEAYEYPSDPILFENLKIYNAFNIASKYLNLVYDQDYIHGIDASIGNANYLGTAPSASALYDTDHILDSNFNLLFESYAYPSDPILYENLKIYNTFNISDLFKNVFGSSESDTVQVFNIDNFNSVF